MSLRPLSYINAPAPNDTLTIGLSVIIVSLIRGDRCSEPMVSCNLFIYLK